MKPRSSARLVFVTGSDTGAGKTVLTALLAAHLRRKGIASLAIKPFCSGGREDAELLRDMQEGDIPVEEVNPFCFAEPLAPLVAARKHGRSLTPAEVLRHVHSIRRKLENSAGTENRTNAHPSRPVLLIEGAGGLLVPLCNRFSVLDLILRLRCEVLVAAPNRLGTINHSLLTLQALRRAGVRGVKLALMHTGASDPSCSSNPRILAELASPTPLIEVPFLRPPPKTAAIIGRYAARLEDKLSVLLGV